MWQKFGCKVRSFVKLRPWKLIAFEKIRKWFSTQTSGQINAWIIVMIPLIFISHKVVCCFDLSLLFYKNCCFFARDIYLQLFQISTFSCFHDFFCLTPFPQQTWPDRCSLFICFVVLIQCVFSHCCSNLMLSSSITALCRRLLFYFVYPFLSLYPF